MKHSNKTINGCYREAHKTLKNLLEGSKILPQTLTPSSPPHRPPSRYHIKKTQQDISINKENSRLTQKLFSIRSSFSVKSWEKDYKKSRKYLKPKHQLSRPSSKQSKKRVLLESYNLISYL